MDQPFVQVENSPFNAEQVDLLNRLASTLGPEQWIWLSGYVAGVRSRLGRPNVADRRTGLDALVAGSQAEISDPTGRYRVVWIADGQRDEAGRRAFASASAGGTVRYDFLYERVPATTR